MCNYLLLDVTSFPHIPSFFLMIEMKLIDKLIWVGVLVFYVFLDVGLSAVAFSMGFVEVNPFFTWFNSISLEAFVLVGLVIKVLTVLLMFWVYSVEFLSATCFFYSC